MLSKTIAFILSVYTAVLSLFGFGTKINPPTLDDSTFVPVLRFAASSDSHIKALGDTGSKRLAKMINTSYALAGQDENYKKLDAVVMSGDLTNSGTKAMFKAMYASVRSAIKDGTQFIGVVAKSHDCNTLGRDALNYYSELTGLKTDRHEVINGYHFISISAGSDSSVHYTETQIKWLDEQIADAVADDPSKPVFVFQHEHIYNTVYGSYPEDGWGDEYFVDVLSKYPQVIDISGHSHYPANDPRAIYQDVFTAINDGGLAYYELTVEGERTYHPDDSDDMAQFLYVEVNAENQVRVRVYDLTAEAFVWEFFIDNVTDAQKTKYSQSLRKSAAKAPVFENTDIKYKKCGSKYTFTVAPATPDKDDIVFIYHFTLTDNNGNVIETQSRLSDYYSHLTPQDVVFTSSKLKKGNSYTVSVSAVDAWDKESEPVTLKIDL